VQNHQQTYWQVWTLLLGEPRLGKLHGLETHEEWGTQDQGRESTRLVNKELCDLWKIPTPKGHSLWGDCRCSHTPERKSPGSDSIFLEFILHAGSTLKS